MYECAISAELINREKSIDHRCRTRADDVASEPDDEMATLGPDTQPLQSSGRPCSMLNKVNVAGSQMRTRAMTRLRERERVDYSAL